MKINDTKQLMKNCILAKVKVPLLLIGAMGVGKSQIVKQVADETGYKLIDLRLAQQEAGDLIGLPYKNGDNGTHWAKPEWFPKEGEKCIIFLDELNRAATDVRQAVFQLVLDRRIHTHKLPDDCFVHAAINPSGDMGSENYQVEQLDPAMIRRFCSIVIDPDADTWLSWAKGDGKIDNLVSEFISVQPTLLFQDEKIDIKVKPTPDSYRMLDLMLKAKVIEKHMEMEVLKGLIGKEAGAAFIKWLDTNYKRPVSGSEVLKEYPKFAAKIKKQETAENYNTVKDLVAILSNKKELSQPELANCAQFFIDLPKESQTAFMQKLSEPMRIAIAKDQRVATLLIDLIDESNGIKKK